MEWWKQSNLSRISAVTLILLSSGCAQWQVDVDQQDRLISYSTHEETEPSVAVDPRDQARVMAAIIGMGQWSAVDNHFINRGCRISHSDDGGASWQRFLIKAEDHDREEFSDPAIAIDERGVAYISGFFHDRDSDGDFSRIRPMLARIQPDLPNQAEVIYFDDGSGRRLDKPYLASAQHEGQTRLYIVYTSVSSSDDHERQIRVIAIDDPDSLFDAPHPDNTVALGSTILAQGNNWGAHPAVGPDGEVYVAWQSYAPALTDSPTNFLIKYIKFDPQRERWGHVQLLAEMGPSEVIDGVMRYPRSPALAVSHETITRGWVYATFADHAPLYVPVTLPHAERSNARAINDQGQVVGWYQDRRNGQIVAFRRSRSGSYDVFAYPDAQSTVASGINGQGAVVGTFTEDSGVQRGYLWRNGQFTLVYYPASLDTHAQDIDNEGQVVGWYVRQDQQAHGFIRSPDGEFVSVDHPGATHTFLTGIGATGDVVGHYLDDAGTAHGFRYRDGAWTPLHFAAAQELQPADINRQGDVVGSFSDDNARVHGFVIQGDQVTILDYPGADHVYVTGINDKHEITGYTLDEDKVRPFVMVGFGQTQGSDIWMLRSANGGDTWRWPVRVHAQAQGDQFFPWLCSAGDGSVFVAWLDRRNDPNNLRYHLYATATRLGSMTFVDDVRVTQQSSDPSQARKKENDNGFIGDYIGLACGNDRAYPVWPDLRNAPPQDIYGARLRIIDP